MAKKQKTLGVGIIGCGSISQAYFDAAKKFEILKIVSCADIKPEAAKEQAKKNGCKAQTVKALLANKDIDLVINLTVPAAHAKVNIAALKAGKHVHCEKPLAVTLEDAQETLDLAKKKSLLVGCAPDTFLGAGLQTCRKIIDDGWLGKIVSGTAFFMSRGPECWHPNPAFFYEAGAGPMFDMGPYYVTALVHLLGPVKRVAAITSKAFEERIATSEQHYGKLLPVEVPTHNSGTLEFHSGATITMTISFDVHCHGHSPIELYGTEGSMKVPDPNNFSGPIEIFTPSTGEWHRQSFSHPYTDNMRSIGAADLAYATIDKRKHRASGDLAYHVLEVMHAFDKSSTTKKHVMIKSKPEQPAPLPLGILTGRL